MNGSSLTHDLSIPPDQLPATTARQPTGQQQRAATSQPARSSSNNKRMDRSIDGGSSAGKGQLRVLALGVRARAWTLAGVQRSVGYQGRGKHTHRKFTETNVHCVLHHSPLYFPLIPLSFVFTLLSSKQGFFRGFCNVSKS